MAGISFSAMSKSKRRLLVSLSFVVVVAALGGVGIWQLQANKVGVAKGDDPKAASASAKKSSKNSAKSTGQNAIGKRTLNGDEASPATGALDDEADEGFNSRSTFPAKPRASERFDESPPSWKMPSPQETVVRGNGVGGGAPGRPTSRFVAAEEPAEESEDESTDEYEVDSEDPAEGEMSTGGNPFGRRTSQENDDDASEGAAYSSARRGGAFQPPSDGQYGASSEIAEPYESDEVAGEDVDNSRDEEYADLNTASTDAVNLDEAPESIESEEEGLPGHATASGRAALGAPVELNLGDARELPARPLRAAAGALADETPAIDAAPLGSQPAPAEEALAVPGPRHLEGSQTPMLSIEKLSPAEVQVNRPATVKVVIRNVGQVAAQDVMVFDQVPQGARLEDTSPPASQGPDGSIVWQLGDLGAGEQAEVTMRITPETEGELGSVAKVAFQAQATSRSISTRPQLAIKQVAPARVLIGQQVLLSITISNPGTGAAENVVLEETLPEGLAHPAGRELEYEVGLLRPGETRSLQLELVADKAGSVENLLVVRGAGELVAEDRAQIEVIAPLLDVAVKGPAKRYLQRPATYNIALLNGGTAPAKNVELVSYLPKGLKFLSANNQGRYDAPNHAVYWSLAELPPGAKGDVQVTAEPIEVGEQKLRIEGRADLGLAKVIEQAVLVEGLAELFFTVADSADPIEVGSETIYQVRVQNQGSKVDTNVQLAVELPNELQPIAGEGPVRHEIQGQLVVFEPLPRLGPQEEVVFKVQVRGLGDGDHKAKIVLSSDEAPTPVSKEEATRVYAD